MGTVRAGNRLAVDRKAKTMRIWAALAGILLKARPILFYGLLLAVLAFSLKWLQWKFLISDYSIEIYIGLIAVLFTVFGAWVATQLAKPKGKTMVIEKTVYLEPPEEDKIDENALENIGLTNREYDVLKLLSQGHPNAEIAATLFLSVSTVKTHISNLFVKMDVRNRAQAVAKAKRLRLVQ